MRKQAPKEPLMALMLTFILPGLGHIYTGRVIRGIAFFLFNVAVVVGGINTILDPDSKIYTYILAIALMVLVFGIFIFIDAYRCAKLFNEQHKLKQDTSGVKMALLIVGLIIFYFINVNSLIGGYVRENVVQAFHLSSSHMSPIFRPGDRILVNKMIYAKEDPQRGDIIAFRYPPDPNRFFLMRVIAKGGETVTIKRGDVYIDGKAVEAPVIKDIYYFNSGSLDTRRKKVLVPEGHFFVLGDNSRASNDSRYWGFVPREYIVGKAYNIYFPLERAAPLL